MRELLKHDFKAESELCDLLSEHAKEMGWRVFPETGDHDLLLVATSEVQTKNARPGDQIGVQAKLRANIGVLAQAMPHNNSSKGPHFHAVLVPVSTRDFQQIAWRCGIFVIEATHRKWGEGRVRRERHIGNQLTFLPGSLRHYYDEMEWHPDVEILVPAGVKSPKRVTPWKVKAVRLCLEAMNRGFVTTADFRHAGVSMTRWKQGGWIEATGEKIGRSMKYRLVPEANLPHIQWPEIAATLAVDNELDEKGKKRRR